MNTDNPQTTPNDTDATAAADPLQLVSFKIGVEEYAIPILAVQEINRLMPMTRVPHAPTTVEGVINLRGRIIPVIDLHQRFGHPPHTGGEEARVVVVEVGPSRRVIGFTVDRVYEVLRLDPAIVDAAPSAGHASDRDYISGVGKLDDRLLILLDLKKLFTSAQLAALDAAA
jgi:purine-binding chemotaxis protein CheW